MNPSPKLTINATLSIALSFNLCNIGIGIKKMMMSVARCTEDVASHQAPWSYLSA